MAHLCLETLGSTVVSFEGAPIPRRVFGRARALLIFLAVERNQPHRREALAELLWPDADEATARTNLRKALHVLRQALVSDPGDLPHIAVDRSTVRFVTDSDYHLDVEQFTGVSTACPGPAADTCSRCLERMKTAAQRYRGPFLTDFAAIDGETFQDWISAWRERLHRQAVALLERLTECHDRLGTPAQAVKFAHRYSEIEPWDEAGQRRLMRLLARTGQPGAAISHFRTFTDALMREHGIEPEEATRRLADQIREGAFTTGDNASLFTGREQRRVTVLACEALPPKGDPEALGQALSAWEDAAKAAIAAAGGQAFSMHGGSLLGYFGFPVAREDATRVAVETALALRDQNAALPCTLAVHNGTTLLQPDRPAPDALGIPSRVARQLLLALEPGEVAVTDTVQRLVDGYFHFRPHGSLRSGREPELNTFLVTGTSGAADRLDAATALSPLLGRDQDLARLRGAWQRARRGKGQVVAICGDPGLGKSRLARAFRTSVVDDGGLVLEGRCFSHYRTRTLHPITEVLEQALGLRAATPEQRRQRLCEQLAALGLLSEELVSLLGPLIDLSNEATSAVLSPGQRQLRLRECLLRLFRTLWQGQSTLLILEDLHWADPTTVALLDDLIPAAADIPLLLVTTCRPEFCCCWEGDHTHRLVPAPLQPEDIATLARHIAAHTVLDPATLRQITDRSDGVPLYVEEMTRSYLDRNGADEPPATLNELIEGRLAQLPEAKPVAQVAAALGREFRRDLLAAVAGIEADRLTAVTEQLLRAGIWQRLDRDRHQFKHALVQEAAYNTLVTSQRRAVHGRIADALQSRFAAHGRRRPEEVGYHLARAGRAREAIVWRMRAGDQSAALEAIAHFQLALELLEQLPPDSERDRIEIEVLSALGRVTVELQGYGSVEASRAFHRAWNLAERLELDARERFEVLWGLWLVSSSRGGFARSVELGERLTMLAGEHGDPLCEVRARYALGNPLFCLGRYDEALAQLGEGLKGYLPAPAPDAEKLRLTEDPGVSSLMFVAWSHWFLGRPDQAVAAAERALARAEAIGHPGSCGYALAFTAKVWMLRRDPNAVTAHAARLLELSERHGLGFWRLAASMLLAWSEASRGNRVALATLDATLEAIQTAMPSMDAVFRIPTIDGYAMAGDFDRVLQLTSERLSGQLRFGDTFYQPEFYRYAAAALQAQGDHEQAERQLRHAIAESGRTGARLLELRSRLALCDLLGARLPADDFGRLAALYQSFDEGFDTDDLRAAQTRLG